MPTAQGRHAGGAARAQRGWPQASLLCLSEARIIVLFIPSERRPQATHGSLLPPPASPLPHGPVSTRLKISKMQICSCHFSASDILMTPHCLESNSNSSS